MRVLSVLLLLAACTEPSHGTLARSPAPAASQSPARLPAWRGSRALPRLPDGASKSEAHLAALRAWHTATTAYAQGDAVQSAESFLQSASHLSGGDPEPIARTFAAGRCLAYENAARAYAAAAQFDRAQEKLTALSASDPACTHSIAGALSRLRDDQMKHEPTKAQSQPLWRPL